MGYSRGFVEKQTMRVDTRVLAGAIHVCLALAQHIVGPEDDPAAYGWVLARRGVPGNFVDFRWHRLLHHASLVPNRLVYRPIQVAAPTTR